MKFRLLCLLLIVTALAAYGCGLLSKAPPKVAAVTLTDRVDEVTKAPLNPLTSFPNGSKLFLVTARVENPRKDTKIEARWFYDKEGKGSYLPVDTARVAFDAGSDERYVAFSLAATTTFPSGAYKVQIFLDDAMVSETPFQVE